MGMAYLWFVDDIGLYADNTIKIASIRSVKYRIGLPAIRHITFTDFPELMV